MKIPFTAMLILGTIFTTIALGMIFKSPAMSQQPDVRKGIVYSRVDGTELQRDLVQPPTGPGPFPLILRIHGGGWQIGDRKEYLEAMTNLTKMGYVGASIDYRFAPRSKFPAQLDDVREGLGFLRKQAKTYKIDPDRIAVVGGSAGGQLALLLGMARVDHKPNGVKAIVSFAGPTDFANWTIPEEGNNQLRNALKRDLNGTLEDFLDTSDRKARVMTDASPITYVGKDSPPVLTIHGTADVIVPFTQAEALHDALKRANIGEKLIAVEGGGHGVWPADKMTAALISMIEFLGQHLKGK